MYRIEIRAPSGALRARFEPIAGAYAPGETAPLRCEFEKLRGGACGTLTLRLSAPLAFEKLDHVLVWLGGDEQPRYRGEITSLPWFSGGGDVRARSLWERAAASRWKGAFEGRVRPFLAYAFSQATLPPGVTFDPAAVTNALAVLKADTPHELLGDTVGKAASALEGGAFGVNGAGVFFLAAPSTAVTHRFVLGEWTMDNPDDMSAYRNCVRFPYQDPSGAEKWYEFKIASEIAVFGEAWSETTVPTSVGVGFTSPLAGESAVVTLTQQLLAPAAFTVKRSLTLPIFTGAYAGPVTSGVPVNFALLLAGTLPSVAQAGARVTFRSGLPENFSGSPVTGFRFIVRGRRAGARLRYTATSTNGTMHTGFTSVTSYFGEEAHELYLPASGVTVQTLVLDVAPQDYQAGDTFDVGSGGAYRRGENWFNNPNPVEVTLDAAPAQDATQRKAVTVLCEPFAEAGVNNTPFAWLSDLGQGVTWTYEPAARVTLPGPLSVSSGDVVLIAATSISKVELEHASGKITLSALADEDDLKRFAVPAGTPSASVTAIDLTGNPATFGRMDVRVSSTGALEAYGVGLLRYVSQPVREYSGSYRVLAGVPEDGVAIFERPDGEVALDVQRVRYVIGASGGEAPVTVYAGTPLASTDVDAVLGRILSVEREVRRPGAASGGTS